MELYFTEEEKIDFLKAHNYVIREVSGWLPTYGNRSNDDSFKEVTMSFAHFDFPEMYPRFQKDVDGYDGNLERLRDTYGIDRIFQNEFKKALLSL